MRPLVEVPIAAPSVQRRPSRLITEIAAVPLFPRPQASRAGRAPPVALRHTYLVDGVAVTDQDPPLLQGVGVRLCGLGFGVQGLGVWVLRFKV